MASVKEWEGLHKDPDLSCCAAFCCGTSSSHISTPESNSQNFSIPFTLKETMDATPTNRKKLSSLLRSKSNGDTTTNCNPSNGYKNTEFKRPTSNGCGTASASPSTWVCRNLACKNDVSLKESFCKRCSCCLCHRFDDNKDPSLWLVCSSEVGSTEKDFCGASCHVECAIQQGRVGCVSIGNALNIDGSHCCAYCGKVSGILGFWRRQLEKAKEARRVDNLCQRIYIAFRLLKCTHRFKELHHIVADAYEKMETEVGPLNGVSAKMERSIVSRLPVSGDVQRLCSLGVEKVDQLLLSSEQDAKLRDSLPAACKFRFEHITSSSLVIILKETPSTLSELVKGYKLWYCKSRDQDFARCPHILQKAERKILIDNLEPCTEYCFRIISFTEEGDMGHSESRCFTGSIEIIINPARPRSQANKDSSNRSYRSVGFKIRDVGRILRQAWAEEGLFQGFFPTKGEEETAETEKDSCGAEAERPRDNTARQHRRSVSRRLDLNATAVPDLNVEVVAGPEDSGDSHTFRENEMETETETETESGHGVQVEPATGRLDKDYEYCVKVVRWLECSGYIDKSFRMRFLTWFSLGSSEEERSIVLTFIITLIDDPSSLACQLEDSFIEIVSSKKPRHELCTKLWH